MNSEMSPAIRLNLDDVLGNLQHARRTGDLGRLAFVTYWEVRKWARCAGQPALAERASNMITMQPHPSKTAFLEIVDEVIFELERLRTNLH